MIDSSWPSEQRDGIRYLIHAALKLLGGIVTVERENSFPCTEADSGRATLYVDNCSFVLFTELLEALGNEPETAAQRGLRPFGKAEGVLGKMAMAPSPSLAQAYTSPVAVAVAVWEWQDGLGIWHPYSAAVCSYIEQQFVQQKGQRFGLGSLAHSIPLGQADPSLAPYIIDLPSWTQFRQDTGKTHFASGTSRSAC